MDKCKNSSDMEDKIFDIVTDLIRNDISKTEAIDKLLILHSVSNCLHENTYPIDRFGNSNCHDCGKFISHNDC